MMTTGINCFNFAPAKLRPRNVLIVARPPPFHGFHIFLRPALSMVNIWSHLTTYHGTSPASRTWSTHDPDSLLNPKATEKDTCVITDIPQAPPKIKAVLANISSISVPHHVYIYILHPADQANNHNTVSVISAPHPYPHPHSTSPGRASSPASTRTYCSDDRCTR